MTLNSTLQSLSALSGPAIAGVLIAWQGIALSYSVHCCLVLVSMLVLLPVRVATSSKIGRTGMRLAAVREGLAYLRNRPVVLGAMTLDMFAVLFGGAKALLPIYAVDILHADAAGYGLLTASLDAGALLAAALMVALPTPTRLGRTSSCSTASTSRSQRWPGVSPYA